ncbi:MAG: hypothetical protein ABJ308_17355 [Halieaceae bacterium]
MSHNTVLLEFTGRKSGKKYAMPVSYYQANAHVYCFTDKANQWWRNLVSGDPISLFLRGRSLAGKPSVSTTATEETQAILRSFLIASPRDASHAGVALDSAGQPCDDDIAAACEKLVLISIDLETMGGASAGEQPL